MPFCGQVGDPSLAAGGLDGVAPGHRVRAARPQARYGEVALASGEAVVVFPEGTTTDGTEVKPFHASLLQPLVHAHGWAVPVGLRYVCEDGSRDPAPAYVAERSLWDTTLLITARPALEAELFFGEPVHAVGRHRRDLAEVTAASVASCLGLPSPARRQPS
jgi:1-acyl-sn-glycerol-3-phosphate acyltransferase